MLMLNRVIAFVALALGSCLMLGCQTQVLTPAQLQAAQAASDTYRAYERGDCATVRRLADPDLLKTWEFNEMRHSMLLVQGFCREIDGDIAGARDIYRELVLDAPTSFAADHAAERARILKLVEQDPDYARRTRAAREGVDPDGRTRTPLDRIPVEFPPLAHAMAIEGYTVVEFGVTQRGDTEDPVVVDSSPPCCSTAPRFVPCVAGSIGPSPRWMVMIDS
jgi:hypothetical protein